MKKPTYENIVILRGLLPQLFADKPLQSHLREDLFVFNEKLNNSRQKVSFKILCTLGFGYNAQTKEYWFNTLVEETKYTISEELAKENPAPQVRTFIHTFDAKNISSLSPGLIIEREVRFNYGKTYDDMAEIVFDTKDVTYGRYSDFDFLELLEVELHKLWLPHLAKEYCGVVKPAGSDRTFIFPSMAIGAATYFHNRYLADSCVKGDIKHFEFAYQGSPHKVLPEWTQYLIEYNNYVRPDKFYIDDPFAKREFYAVYKRILQEVKKNPAVYRFPLLLRFPFAPGEERRFKVHGILLGDKYFYVHEISEYDINPESKVYSGILTIDLRRNLLKKAYSQRKGVDSKWYFQSKKDTLNELNMDKWKEKDRALKEKGYQQFDFGEDSGG